MPDMGTASGLEWLNGGTYGTKFKEDARRYYGSFVCFSGRGEMIPNDDCFAELDPTVKDKFGIPVLRFHWKWSRARDSARPRTCRRPRPKSSMRWAAAIRARRRAARRPSSRAASSFTKSAAPSWATIPKKSVTNSFGQCWDMKNLFITDGATLCSNADKNPTLTIMALAWRASDHMLGLMKRKEL